MHREFTSADLKVLERDEKICLDFHVRSDEVLHRVEEERNVVQTANRRKANWIGQILCRNCLLKQVIEGKIRERT